MERFVVDRIEGKVAVLEHDDLSHEEVPLADLPKGVRDGTCLVREDGHYAVDRDAEKSRRTSIDELTNKLFKK